MARFDDLEFTITANTSLLRGELARGTDAVNNFANKTEASLSRHATTLEHVSRTARRVFELYGAIRGFDAFKSWIEGATQLDKLTQSQADQLQGVKSAMEEVQKATDALAQTIALKLAPGIENAARFWREFLLPTGGEKLGAELDKVHERVSDVAKELANLQGGGFYFGNKEARIAQLREQLDLLLPKMRELEAQQNKLDATPAEKTLGQLKWDEKLKALQEINVNARPASSLFAGPGTNDLERAAKLAEELATPLQKDIEKLHEIQDLVSRNLLRPELLQNFMDEKLTGFDLSAITAKFKEFKPAMTEAEKEAKQFATAFSASFESRGIQAILDGDLSGGIRGLARDFAELFLRLTVLKPAADALASALGGISASGAGGGGSSSGGGGGFFKRLFSGGSDGGGGAGGLLSLFGGLFGGNMFGTGVGGGIPFGDLYGFAAGGRPAVGVPSWVGEKGPELFVPDSAGMIVPNAKLGGGTTLVQHINVQAGIPAQWAPQLAEAGKLAARAAFEAVTAHNQGRR